jgi:hypothetical protein
MFLWPQRQLRGGFGVSGVGVERSSRRNRELLCTKGAQAAEGRAPLQPEEAELICSGGGVLPGSTSGRGNPSPTPESGADGEGRPEAGGEDLDLSFKGP